MKQNQEAILRRIAQLTESQQSQRQPSPVEPHSVLGRDLADQRSETAHAQVHADPWLESSTLESNPSAPHNETRAQANMQHTGYQANLETPGEEESTTLSEGSKVERAAAHHASQRSSGSPLRPSVTRTQEAVVKAYTAVHGHPMEHDGRLSSAHETRRWALGMRAGLALLVVLALVVFIRQCSAISQDSRTEVSVGESSATQDGAQEDPSNNNVPPAQLLATSEPNEKTRISSKQPDDGNLKAEPAPDTSDSSQGSNSTLVVVHVAGHVKTPGVYELPSTARVIDAITSAGGFLPTADANHLNLAQLIEDGAQIYVPEPGEAGVQRETPLGASPKNTNASEGLINLNTATSAELEELPGVGPTLAQRIVDWRTEHGAFAAVEELASVKGVGPAIMGEITSLVTL